MLRARCIRVCVCVCMCTRVAAKMMSYYLVILSLWCLRAVFWMEMQEERFHYFVCLYNVFYIRMICIFYWVLSWKREETTPGICLIIQLIREARRWKFNCLRSLYPIFPPWRIFYRLIVLNYLVQNSDVSRVETYNNRMERISPLFCWFATDLTYLRDANEMKISRGGELRSWSA